MSRITSRLGWGIAGALAIALLATLGGVIYAGPLSPPGPPSATGPTQIFSLPYTISTPGSYVVAADLTCTTCGGGVGISIGVGDVTLDLGGFAVRGVGQSGFGIAASGTPANIEIRNGELLDWKIGIYFVGAVNSRLHDLRVHNSEAGIWLDSTTTVTQSSLTNFDGDGIIAQGSSNVILNNSVNVACGSAINLYSASVSNAVIDNVVSANLGCNSGGVIAAYGSQNRIDGNTVDGNGDTAILVGVGANFNAVTRNTSTNAGATPFRDLGSNNTFGPTQTGAGLSNPWANIAH